MRDRASVVPIEDSLRETLARLEQTDLVRRIWQRDASTWVPQSEAQRHAITNRLGWLSAPERSWALVSELESFAAEVRAAGLRRAVLLGMGGSSLAPEVLRRTFGVAPGYLDLVVLDTTDPATIVAIERSAPLSETLFIVASKSGTTAESVSLHRYFYARLRAEVGLAAGTHFVAITDPGTPLEALAREQGFRRVFLAPADVGGRYSALTYYGLVPAALLGVDLRGLLNRAARMARACGPQVPLAENPGLWLGAVLGAAARAGRDKVTLVLPPELESFGLWAEQLLAESTGKHGRGLVPVAGEPLGTADVYGADRLFVVLRRAPQAPQAPPLGPLMAAGHPVIALELGEVLDLGAEFFRWEFATAVAGAVLGIDPFDEPNVQESKDNTRRVLERFAASGELPESAPSAHGNGLQCYGESAAVAPRPRAAAHAAAAALPLIDLPLTQHLDPEAAVAAHLASARPGNYLALLAYLPSDQAHHSALHQLRVPLRDRLRVATTVGFGPRYLHSTGQLHKGGPASGLFLLITADDDEDIPVPGEPHSFGTLKRAQALGDFESLQAHGRLVLRLHIERDAPAALRRLAQAVSGAADARK